MWKNFLTLLIYLIYVVLGTHIAPSQKTMYLTLEPCYINCIYSTITLYDFSWLPMSGQWEIITEKPQLFLTQAERLSKAWQCTHIQKQLLLSYHRGKWHLCQTTQLKMLIIHIKAYLMGWKCSSAVKSLLWCKHRTQMLGNWRINSK